MKIQKYTIIGLILALILALFGGVILPASAALPPVVKVVGVNPGSQVQLQVTNMPANVEFAVSMGAAGSKGVGPVVAHVVSGVGGTQAFWVEILADVRGNSTIEVRIDSGTGLASWTSFNNTSAYTAPAATAVPAVTATTAPVNGTGGALTTSLKILHVQKGGWVQAEMRNLPLSTNFSVVIGPAGLKGVGGFLVAHVETSASGPAVTTGTFEIPLPLRDKASLDLTLQAGGYLFVKTFSNVDQ